MLAVGGYCLKVMKQSVHGETLELPEWDDWGNLILEGLKGAALVLIHLLPGYLILFGGIFLATFGQLLVLPLTGLLASSGDPEAFVASTLAIVALSFGSALLQLVVMAVALCIIFLGLIPLPLALGHYLHEGELSAGVRLRQIWGYFKVNKSGFLAAWVIFMGLGYLLSLSTIVIYMTIVLICLLPFIIAPIAFYSYLIGAAVFGQYYRESRALWERRMAKMPASE
jgi:hypothetical protein